MGQAKNRKKNGQYPEKKDKVFVMPPPRSEDEETMGRYDFRPIKEEEKPHIKFNDGDLAFTIQFVDRSLGNGILYSAAQFRTMTDLTADEFKAALPVVPDPFWTAEMLAPMERILREDWEKKLKGDVIFNDGDRLVKMMLLSDGNEGMDYLLRKDTDLSRSQFLKAHPVTVKGPWTSEMTDKWLAEVQKLEAQFKEKAEAELNKLPRYTAESVAALFKSDDPRIKLNEYGTCQCIQLSDEEGYFKFSDRHEGTVTFYTAADVPMFTAAVTITDKMRAGKCDTKGCKCKSKWFELLHGCQCSEHHPEDFHDVIPRIELCDPKECDGKHVHLLGFCAVCFDIDLSAGKALKDITADNIHQILR